MSYINVAFFIFLMLVPIRTLGQSPFDSPDITNLHSDNDLSLKGINGKAKTISKQEYQVVDSFGHVIKKSGVKTVTNFNTRGFITQIITYDQKGKQTSKETREYMHDTDLITIINIQSSSIFTTRVNLKYDNYAKEISTYDSRGSLKTKLILKYDSARHIDKASLYEEDGDLRATYLYTYGDDGFITDIEEITTSLTTHYGVYTHNSIKQLIYREDLSKHCTFTYNAYGHIENEVSTNEFDPYEKKYSYKYDNNLNPIEASSFELKFGAYTATSVENIKYEYYK